MSYHNFPRVHSYIANLCASNKEVLKLFNRFEHALKVKEELRIVKSQAHKDMQNLELDLMMLRKADQVKQQMRQQINSVENMLMVSYDQLLELANLLNDDRLRNMLRFGVLRKQIEVQEKLNRIEAQQIADTQYKASMESRTVVQEFRKWQRALKVAEDRYARVKLETQECKSQWRIKIDRVTKLRNQKIVALLQIRKQLIELEAPPEKRQLKEKPVVKRDKPKPIAFQSAIDFLENYPITTTVKDAPLQSILVVNRSQDAADESKPPKQVQFAPLPSPIRKMDEASSEIDTPDESSELPSEQETDNKAEPLTKDFPERATVQDVQILPSLQLSMEFSTASDQNLSFKDMFPSDKSIADDNFDNDDNKKDYCESNSSNSNCEMPSTIMKNYANFLKMDDDDDVDNHDYDDDDHDNNVNANVDDNDCMDFPGATISNQTKDFFLLEFDDNSAEQANTGRTYDL